jgi:hypothetical protein
MLFRRARALALAAVAGVALGAHAQLRLLPAHPQAGESFAIVGAYRLQGSCLFAKTSVRVEGNEVRIDSPRVVDADLRNEWCRLGATVDGLAQGAYDVTSAPLAHAVAGNLWISMRANVAPPAIATPEHRGLDGNWFDPQQPGWGMNLVQSPSGALFGVWLGYQATFRPPGHGGEFDVTVKDNEWLVMSAGRWVSPTQYRGLLHASMGAPINQGRIESHLSPVGLATITFTDRARARLSIQYATIFGEWFEGEWNLHRMEF